MKVGLYFGSFNPIHVGHLIIASYMADNTDLDQVWMVVSPQNPLKPKKGMLGEFERYDLVKTAIEDEPKLKVSDIEFSMPRPSYTIDTLLYLEEKHPTNQFVVIMGVDAFNSLPKWKNYEQIMNGYGIYVYPRPGFKIQEELINPKVKYFEQVPLMDISSTHIRNAIKNKKSARFYLTEKVFELVDKWGYYLK